MCHGIVKNLYIIAIRDKWRQERPKVRFEGIGVGEVSKSQVIGVRLMVMGGLKADFSRYGKYYPALDIVL